MVASPRYAFLFPGQGSQQPGMGRALAETYPAAREVFDIADRVLGRPLSKLCFEGPDTELALTENTQPAMLCADIASLRALESRGLRPESAAGHSLGEYAAHVCAGTYALADALQAVQARARFMQEAVPVGVGAMAAILGMEPSRVSALCSEAAGDEVVSPANLNGPSQVVIAGHEAAVQRTMKLATAAGAKRAVRLPVSAPFHCRLMQPAAEAMVGVLDATSRADPRLPVYTNVDAAPVISGREAQDALERQIASPVRWQESVEAMIATGIEVFVEVGPGRVLSGLVRGIDRSVRVLRADTPEAVEAVAQELGR